MDLDNAAESVDRQKTGYSITDMENTLEPTGKDRQNFYGFGAACNEKEWTKRKHKALENRLPFCRLAGARQFG